MTVVDERSTADKHRDATAYMIAVMNLHLDAHDLDSFDFDECARAWGYSRFMMGKIFLEVTGYAPNHYLTRMRMRQAMKLLALPQNLLVSSVARMIGYKTNAAICGLFKRELKMTPTQWRERAYRTPALPRVLVVELDEPAS